MTPDRRITDRQPPQGFRDRCRRWRDHRRAWWAANSQTVIGVAVVLVGIATMIVGVWVWQLQAETDARAKRADRNAQITCLRAVKLAPYSTRFLQQADVYPKDVFTTFQGQRISIYALAASSIPKTCD